jgi:ABC-type Na+ efflux pump permease subunit
MGIAAIAAFWRQTAIIARNEIRHALRERLNRALVIWLPALALPLLALIVCDTAILAMSMHQFTHIKLGVAYGDQESKLQPLLEGLKRTAPITIINSPNPADSMGKGLTDAYVEISPSDVVTFHCRDDSIDTALSLSVSRIKSDARAGLKEETSQSTTIFPKPKAESIFHWHGVDEEPLTNCSLFIATLFMAMYTLNFPVNCLRDAFAHKTLETDLCLPTSTAALVTGKYLSSVFLSHTPLILVWLSVSPLFLLAAIAGNSYSDPMDSDSIWFARFIIVVCISLMLQFSEVLRMTLAFAFKQASQFSNISTLADVMAFIVPFFIFPLSQKIPVVFSLIPFFGIDVQCAQLCMGRADYAGIGLACATTIGGILALLNCARMFYCFELRTPAIAPLGVTTASTKSAARTN